MNVEEIIKTEHDIPQESRTIIHIMLVNNHINEAISKALKPFDISIQQFNVLRILQGQGKKTANLSTLNERMVTKMSNTTRLVDKLILKEFVDRVTCPSNRRKVEISITPKGQQELQGMNIAVNKAEKNILKNLSANEMKQLNSLLNKF